MHFHQRCVLVWWRQDSPSLIDSYEHVPSVQLNLRQLFPADWGLIQGVLFYFNDSGDDEAEVNHPDQSTEVTVSDEPVAEEADDDNDFHDADSFRSAVSNFFIHDKMTPELLAACQ